MSYNMSIIFYSHVLQFVSLVGLLGAVQLLADSQESCGYSMWSPRWLDIPQPGRIVGVSGLAV